MSTPPPSCGKRWCARCAPARCRLPACPAPISRPCMASPRGIETALDARPPRRPNPGRPSLHRLNRAEYANAIRDLLALDVDAASLLPPDDSADGFDNNADILGVSPALLERYLSAAARISALAVGSARIPASSETYRVRGDASQTEHQEGLPLGTRGGLLAQAHVPARRRVPIKVKLLETNLGSIRGLEDRSTSSRSRWTASACCWRRWAGRTTTPSPSRTPRTS